MVKVERFTCTLADWPASGKDVKKLLKIGRLYFLRPQFNIIRCNLTQELNQVRHHFRCSVCVPVSEAKKEIGESSLNPGHAQ